MNKKKASKHKIKQRQRKRGKDKHDKKESQRLNIVMAGVWVAQKTALSNPIKVELTSKDKNITVNGAQKSEPKEAMETMSEDESDEEEIDMDEDEDMSAPAAKNSIYNYTNEDEDGDIDKLYRLSAMDEESDEEINLDDNLAKYYDEVDDPILANEIQNPKVKAALEEDELSEQDNHMIRPDDNLVVLARLEQFEDVRSFSLEVHVYNENESTFYTHHDNILANAPICMEWMHYDPTSGEDGNFVAIGNMDNYIEIWDLDQTSNIEPTLILGRAPVLSVTGKKRKNKKKVITHHDSPVTCLAWNKHDNFRPFLASGSADSSVILWDMFEAQACKRLKLREGVVGALAWHPTTGTSLVFGSSTGEVFIIDCLALQQTEGLNHPVEQSLVNLGAEVEKVAWVARGEQWCVMVSTNAGEVHLLDPSAKAKLLWKFKACEEPCGGLQLSPLVPGLLLTASEAGSVSVWDASTPDVGEKPPVHVTTLTPRVGRITCLSLSPEHPFVMLVGGDRVDKSHAVWDIRNSKQVRERFCERMGMPVDAENDEKSALVKEDLDSSSDDEESEEEVEEESKSIEILRSAWEEQCQIGASKSRVDQGERVTKVRRGKKK